MALLRVPARALFAVSSHPSLPFISSSPFTTAISAPLRSAARSDQPSSRTSRSVASHGEPASVTAHRSDAAEKRVVFAPETGESQVLQHSSLGKATHSGQIWQERDYRNVRFVDKRKLINENFAINLVNAVPAQPMAERVVYCDGGNGSTGHPRVYINLDKPGEHACGYCGLKYVLDHDAAHGAAHGGH